MPARAWRLRWSCSKKRATSFAAALVRVRAAAVSAKDALFWIMTACVTGGLVCGLALLGSPALAELSFRTGSRLARPKRRRNWSNCGWPGAKCTIFSGATAPGWRW